MSAVHIIYRFVYEHRKRVGLAIGLVALLCIITLLVSYIVIGKYSKYIADDSAQLAKLTGSNEMVGVVPGGGIEGENPQPLLEDRLNAAAALLQAGKVRKLIVSGDNRFLDYNEPRVMQNYLIHQKHVDPKLIQLDNAGRSTYETCQRARDIFGLSKVLLISESTHLPRAIYLCRSFGLEAYGYKSNGLSARGLQVGQRSREVEARLKAIINVYLIGEQTVLGPKIKI
jgi:SanA protein